MTPVTLRRFLGAAAICCVAAPASGQIVSGRLVDRATGEPLQGAFVVLLDGVGIRRSAALTSREGRYILRAPAAGRYTLRTERIGYANLTSEPLELTAGETRIHDMALSFQAIPLDSISVGGRQRCTVRPGTGLRTAEVWDEASKALRLAAWTEEQGAVRFRALGYERDLDPLTLRVIDERRTARQGYTSGSPYKSLAAPDLAENGYIRPVVGGTFDYHAPDARVHLSDSFLDGHCFQLAEHDSRPELIGLAFRPVARSDRADIEGVLWVDRQSSELRFLEYTYTQLPHPVQSRFIGGRVEFDRLLGGPWIVRSWHIRMPQVAAGRQPLDALGASEQQYRIVGIREVGAEVQDVVAGEGASLLTEVSGGGAVVGVVDDGRSGALVSDVAVSVVGTLRDARTDAGGAFELHGIPDGRYDLRATPGTWDLPWLPPVTGEVTIQGGETSRVRLHLPTPHEIVRSLCGATVDDTVSGAIVGRVTDTANGQPVAGRRIVLTWIALAVVDDGVNLGTRGTWRAVVATSDPDGWYMACGLPAEIDVRIRALPPHDDSPDNAARRLWQLDLPLPPDAREARVRQADQMRRVDLAVGAETRDSVLSDTAGKSAAAASPLNGQLEPFIPTAARL